MTDLSSVSTDLLRQLVLFLGMGLPGLPPGNTDPELLRAIPPDAIFAVTWNGRHVPPSEARTGLQAALADTEIANALNALQKLSEVLATEGASATDDQQPMLSPEFAALLWKHPGCLFVTVGPPLGGGRGLRSWLQVGLVVSAGDECAQVLAAWPAVAPSWLSTTLLEKENSAGPATTSYPYRELSGRLVWGSPAAIGGVEQRLRDKVGGLEEVSGFIPLRAEFSDLKVASQVFVQIPAPVAALLTALPVVSPELRDWLQSRLPQIGSVRLLAGMGCDEQGNVIARTAISGNGLATGDRPIFPSIDMNSLQRVPADAHLVGAMGLDLSALLDNLWGSVEAGLQDRPRLNELRQRVEVELGLDIAKDILPAFGSTWVISSSPSTGGAVGMGPILSLNVRDPEKAGTAFKQAMGWLRQHLPEGARLTTEDFQQQTLYTLQLPEGQLGGLAPCLCLTGQDCLLTLQPQTMRAHLRFLTGNARPSFATQQGNLQWPTSPHAVFFVDAPRLTEVVWPLLPTVANPVMNRLAAQGLEIDGSIWPSTSAILEYSRPCTASVRSTPYGTVWEVRQPLSLAVPVLAIVAIPAFNHAANPGNSPGNTAIEIELGAASGEKTGEAKGVNQAMHEEPSPSERSSSWVPGLIRGVTPTSVQQWIPPEVLRRIEEGPDPARQQLREERRQQRLKRREVAP